MSQEKLWKTLMSSLVAFLAKTSALQANGQVFKRGRGVDFGLNSLVSLATYDRALSCWKMSQQLTLWGEQLSLERLPKWGMTRNGVMYELPTLAHRIAVNAGSVWPTASATDTANRQPPLKYVITENGLLRHLTNDGEQSEVRLSQTVKFYQHWPTPRANERNQQNSRDNGVALSYAVRNWPTPRASDYKHSRATQWEIDNDRDELHVKVAMWSTPLSRDHRSPDRPDSKRAKQRKNDNRGMNLNDQVKGKLNPGWVEQLMGFPLGWTDISGLHDPESHNIQTKRHESQETCQIGDTV